MPATNNNTLTIKSKKLIYYIAGLNLFYYFPFLSMLDNTRLNMRHSLAYMLVYDFGYVPSIHLSAKIKGIIPAMPLHWPFVFLFFLPAGISLLVL